MSIMKKDALAVISAVYDHMSGEGTRSQLEAWLNQDGSITIAIETDLLYPGQEEDGKDSRWVVLTPAAAVLFAEQFGELVQAREFTPPDGWIQDPDVQDDDDADS